MQKRETEYRETKMRIPLKIVLLLAAILNVLSLPAMAKSYPEKAVRLIIPYRAGGGTDIVGRPFAVALEEQTGGQPVVVTNITGGGGSTGTISAMKAEPDGYSALFAGSADIISLMVFKKMPFTVDNFKYVGGVFSTPTYVLTHKDRGYTSLKEVLEKAKASPNKLTVGIGGAAHRVMANAIVGYTGAKVRIVQYIGGAKLKKGILANEVDIGIIHAPTLMQEVKAGLLSVLASGGSLKDIPYEPVRNVITLKEMGIPVELGVTRGLWVPKDTPDNVIKDLEALAKKATLSDTYKKWGIKYGFAPTWMNATEYGNHVRSLHKSYTEIKDRFMK